MKISKFEFNLKLFKSKPKINLSSNSTEKFLKSRSEKSLSPKSLENFPKSRPKISLSLNSLQNFLSLNLKMVKFKISKNFLSPEASKYQSPNLNETFLICDFS